MLTRMPGPVALVGSGEFLPAMASFDADLLASTGRFDWLGAAVAALAVGGLAFGVIRGQANAWEDTAAWIAIAPTIAPSQSKAPVADSSRDSCMCRIVAHSAIATSGTLTRNATRHDSRSTSSPPIGWPKSVSADVAAAHVPNARARAAPSNVAVMIDSEPGTSSAPAAPWMRRNTTISSRFGARPHKRDVIPKPVRPIAKIFRRP